MDETGILVDFADLESFEERFSDWTGGWDEFVEVEGFCVGHFVVCFCLVCFVLW